MPEHGVILPRSRLCGLVESVRRYGPMHGSRWTWPGIVASALLAISGACGGDAVTLTPCDGGSCPVSRGSSRGGSSGSSSGGAPFPFSGPSCTGPSFSSTCWGCVQDSCPSTESCLTTDCGGYFGCFCACASGDTACQAACPQPNTTCQTC